MKLDKIWLKAMTVMSPTCHQREERSFHLAGYQFPVCTRCTGVYLGYLVGLFFFYPRLIILIPLTYIDGLIQLKTSYTSTNTIRFITGVISGVSTTQLLKFVLFALIK